MLHWLDGRALSILGLSNSISLLTTSHDKAEQRGSQQRGFTQVHHCAGGIARKASQARGRGGGGGRGGSQASDWITSRLAIVQSELWRVLLLLLLRLLAHWHRCRGSARPRGRLAVRRC